MDILRDINESGTTIVLVTHDTKVAAQSDRIMFMSDRKIIDQLKFPKFHKDNLENRIKEVTQKIQVLGI